jgi:hypothetical protein
MHAAQEDFELVLGPLMPFTTGRLCSPGFPQLGQLRGLAPDGAITLTTFPDGAIPGQIAAGPQETRWALTDTRIWKITIN